MPWRAVKGMREKVVHDYPEVDLGVLWTTLADDIPDLAERMQTYLASSAGAIGDSGGSDVAVHQDTYLGAATNDRS